jgi:predicted transcriptional regulator
MGKVERKRAILEPLLDATEPMRPGDIGEIIGETALNTGRYLSDMARSGLVQKPDKKKPFYEITDKGRDYYENPPEEIEGEELERTTEEKHRREAQTRTTEDMTEEVTEEVTEAIPSQADLFRSIGERLGVGKGKGEVRLDAIIYYVSKTADLDDLNSVWNALAEMAVDNNVKKRWIKIYAQNIPGKKIPEELREKLEVGQEGEKVAVEGKPGEIAPKPKRFSLIGEDIVGDPEGDLTFNEALKLLAQKKGVPPEQASPLAAMVEAMKLGPEMATNTLAAIVPLLTKPEDTSGTNVFLQLLQTQQQNAQQQMQALQQMILALTEDKHKAEMDGLKALITTGQRPPESDQRLDTLTRTVETLRESLHQAQIDSVKQESQRSAELLQGEIKRLEQQITQAAQSQRTESSLGLLGKAVDKLDSQLTGIRSDAKPLVETMMKAGAPGPGPKSPEMRQRIAEIGKRAVEAERRSIELEDELLGL